MLGTEIRNYRRSVSRTKLDYALDCGESRRDLISLLNDYRKSTVELDPNDDRR